MITGETPDANRDYNLFTSIPSLEEDLKRISKTLDNNVTNFNCLFSIIILLLFSNNFNLFAVLFFIDKVWDIISTYKKKLRIKTGKEQLGYLLMPKKQ